MKLKDWIDERIASQGGTRAEVYSTLRAQLSSQGTPISIQTLGNLDRGMKLASYTRAKALSDVTCGVVSIAELCE